MAAKGPPDSEDPGHLDPPPDQVGSDLDAEGEEETDLYEMDQQLQDAVHRSYSGEDGEEDAERGAEAEASFGDAEGSGNSAENDDTAPVGAVKLAGDDEASDEEDADGEYESADGDVDPAFEDDNDQQASEHSDSESEADEEWEAESNGHEDEDVEADVRSRTNCMYVAYESLMSIGSLLIGK